MKQRSFLVAAFLALSVSTSHAAGDAAAGRERAEVCAACHGEHGVSALPGIPSLAGQTDQFLQWQLVFFRSGRRPNPLMAPLVADITDEDIRNLGAYYASLPKPTEAAVENLEPALRAQGQAVAEQHHCAACHTDSFLGKQAAASLAHQREDYLVKALSDYRSSTRPSTGVAAMTEAAAGLSDDEIRAVAHYLAAL